MKYIYLTLPLFGLTLSGCETFGTALSSSNIPQTTGELSTSESYIPIDPISVGTLAGNSCRDSDGQETIAVAKLRKRKPREPGSVTFEALPFAFPDNTTRVAYRQLTADGEVKLGPFGTTQKGERYELIVDYVNSDTATKKFKVVQYTWKKSAKFYLPHNPFHVLNKKEFDLDDTYYRFWQVPKNKVTEEASSIRNSSAKDVQQTEFSIVENYSTSELSQEEYDAAEDVIIPTIVGIGFRARATFTALKGKASIGSLTDIGISADNNFIRGDLVVQSMGVNGRSISDAMPIAAELDKTSVQNALISIGKMQSQLYADNVYLKPRLLGFKNPLAKNEKINAAIEDALSASGINWHRPCVFVQKETTTQKQFDINDSGIK